jgi:DNA repair exonuclease SbcCD nuclease subunit
MTKILLTADWHLKPIHPFSNIVEGKIWDRMCEEKLKVLYSLPKEATRHKVDQVLIAGDVFDTPNPPEALKAELVKILRGFQVPVFVITGRPGEHDFINEQNYVLMDIRQVLISMRVNQGVVIHNSNSMDMGPGVLAFHDMLDGINALYKKTVKLDDERFREYNTILMGDFHQRWYKKYGKKTFIYPGPPYPTRYGEDNHHYAIVDVDGKGNCVKHSFHETESYELIELTNFKSPITYKNPFVLKFKLTCAAENFGKVLRNCKSIKEKLMAVNSKCMDVVWNIKTSGESGVAGEGGNFALRDLCLNYITENAGKWSKDATDLFQKMEKEAE